MGTERHFKLGSFYRICDRTGFATRADRTQREWQGLIVRKEVFEARQPQDFVKGVQDIQIVPYPRPRQTNTFISTGASAQFEALGNGNGIGDSFAVQSGQFQCFNGTIPQVNPANFPSSF